MTLRKKKKGAVVSRREARRRGIIRVHDPGTLAPPTGLFRTYEGGSGGHSDLTLQVSDLAEGELRVFSYLIGPGRDAQFFVRRQSGNSIQVAFAVCRRCYESGASFHGDQLYCRRCRTPMRIINPSEAPEPEADCTMMIPLRYDLSEDRVVVRGETIKGEFQRWFQPILDQE